MGNLQWEKACNSINKYCITNEVKEISFKILHRIYPAKTLLERLKLNIDYSCVFCKSEKETIILLFFHCEHSDLFWTDMKDYIIRKIGTNIQIKIFDVMLYSDFNGLSISHNL